jgi:uncharacterized coiled-coil protein SlyX
MYLAIANKPGPAEAPPEPVNAIAIVPPPATLRTLESRLAELEDTAALVPAEDEAAFLAELGAAIVAATEKRDNFHHYLRYLEAQQAADALEVKRLEARQVFTGKLIDKLEATVVGVIRDLGKDEAGKWKKLAGRHVVLTIQNSPASVKIVDEPTVPAQFKQVSLSMPLVTWDELLDGLDFDQRDRLIDAIKKPAITCDKTAIKTALAAGVVEGAELVTDRQHLRRK